MGGVCSSNQSVHVRSSKDANTENKGEKKVPKSSLRKQKKPSSNGGVPGHVVVADAHIAVVRDLWRRLKPREQQIGARMYKIFFSANPEYRKYFEGTQFTMPGRLMTMFERILDAGSAEGMKTQFAHLGRVHYDKQVPLEAFPRFIDAMLRAIQEDFKKNKMDLTDKERESYFRVCDLISKEIILNMRALKKADALSIPNGESEANSSAASIFQTETKDGGISNERAVEIFQTLWNDKIDENTKLEIGRRFYSIFLTSNPKYRPMFGGNVDHQAALFMNMLGMLSAQGVEKFAQNYEHIIVRHKQRGLDRQAFVKFGKAMIVAMKDVLSSKPGGFSSTEVEAMRQVYTMLSTPMIKAIENAQKKQPSRPSSKPNASPNTMASETIPEHTPSHSMSQQPPSAPGTMPTTLTIAALPLPGPGAGPNGLTPQAADAMHRARRGSGSSASALGMPRRDSLSASANSHRSFLMTTEIDSGTQMNAEMYRRSLTDPYLPTVLGGGTGLPSDSSARYVKYSSGSGTLPRSVSRRAAHRQQSELLSSLRPAKVRSSSTGRSNGRTLSSASIGFGGASFSNASSLSSTQSLSTFHARSRSDLTRRQPHRSTSFQGVPSSGGGHGASASYATKQFSASNRLSAPAKRSAANDGASTTGPRLFAERSRESLRRR